MALVASLLADTARALHWHCVLVAVLHLVNPVLAANDPTMVVCRAVQIPGY